MVYPRMINAVRLQRKGFLRYLSTVHDEKRIKNKRETFRIYQHDSKSKEIVEYYYEHSDRRWKTQSSNDASKRTRKSMGESMLRYVLPSNYPESVQSGYGTYSIYAFLANTVSTATMVLSTQQLLMAVGVGTASAAPISATLNWIIKDGVGQFGGILFASRISDQSSVNIDNNPKRYRMVSSLTMDASSLLEVAAPLFPGSFLLIASIANIGKNIAFLTASASRAKLHHELSRNDNLGDITAKATSQSILSSLLGTGIGISLSPFVLNDIHLVLPLCIGFSFFNQLFTYTSLQAVIIDKLNQHQLDLVLKTYFTERMWSKNRKIADEKHLLHPQSISRRDRFIPFFYDSMNSSSWMVLESSLDQILPHGFDEINAMLDLNENYILNCTLDEKNHLEKVHIIFFTKADFSDSIRAQFQAHLIHAHFDPDSDFDLTLEKNGNGSFSHEIVKASHIHTEMLFGEFFKQLQYCGWNMDHKDLRVQNRYTLNEITERDSMKS